jgi:hypothetical protein
LAVVLGALGIEHPQNKVGKRPYWLYEGKKQRIYPDFVGVDFVLDAKYKRGGICREDRYQMITYMHVMKAVRGVMIYPFVGDEGAGAEREGELNGWGGEVGAYRFGVVSGAADFGTFEALMREGEFRLRKFAAGGCKLGGNMV